MNKKNGHKNSESGVCDEEFANECWKLLEIATLLVTTNEVHSRSCVHEEQKGCARKTRYFQRLRQGQTAVYRGTPGSSVSEIDRL